MFHSISSLSRRAFLGAAGASMVTASSLLAQELARTPALTEGPFYPDRLPLDTDNDLIIVGDSMTPAVGAIANLTGRILDRDGRPLRNAVVEIWQCDGNGVYLHSADSDQNRERRDRNFQGFGRFTTGAAGEYRFRTIKPVPYPGRPAPHIHVKVKKNGRELLTTQCFVQGDAGNARDGIYRALRNPLDRELVTVDFRRVRQTHAGEFAATFDIILGRTPDERDLRPATR